MSVDGADVTELTLQTSAGSSIHGRFTFQQSGDSKRPAPGSVELSPVPVDADLAPSSPATADVHADWSFDVRGINGPRRLQLLRAPTGWTLAEIRVNGIDSTDRPIAFGTPQQSLTDVEVVMTDRVNGVRGTVTDDRGRPAPESTVIVFSSDRGLRYHTSRFMRRQIAGADGAFIVAGLPAGSYYAAAVDRAALEDDDAWEDSELLDSLVPASASFTLGSGGDTVTLNLKLPRR